MRSLDIWFLCFWFPGFLHNPARTEGVPRERVCSVWVVKDVETVEEWLLVSCFWQHLVNRLRTGRVVTQHLEHHVRVWIGAQRANLAPVGSGAENHCRTNASGAESARGPA